MAARQEKNLLAKIEASHYKLDYTPPPQQILASIHGSTIGTPGNFIVFSGLPKAGKSSFLSALLASAITGKDFFGIQMHRPEKSPVAMFDTESNEYNFYQNIARLKRISGAGARLPEWLNIFTTRSENAAGNIELINLYIQKWRPSVVIIDGLLDLLVNYNDERESRELIDWLKRMTNDYGVLIVGVLHTGKKDNHTLGHFGSAADRYAESVLEVVKDQERQIFTLKPKYLRSAAGFPEINIYYNGVTYETIDPPPPTKRK